MTYPQDTIVTPAVTRSGDPVKVNTETGTLVPTPGPNHALPPLNPLMARSTVAMVLVIVSALAPILPTDIGTVAVELVENEDEINAGIEKTINAINAVIGVVAALWFWIERRAPNFRLSLRRQ